MEGERERENKRIIGRNSSDEEQIGEHSRGKKTRRIRKERE